MRENSRRLNLILVILLLLTSSPFLSGQQVTGAIDDEEGCVDIARSAISTSFPGGNGSASNPYQISNVTQLQNMSANLSAHYVLINDIDASATINWDGGKGFDPVGDYSNRFSGSLHGHNYNITYLFINRPSEWDVSLFRYLASESIIKNVSLIDGNVSGDKYVGGLVGWNGGGTVYNCSAIGNVSGDEYVGGLVGYNYRGTVYNCSVTGNVTGDDFIGGLVGYNWYGTVSNCSTTGKVSETGSYSYFIGGLVGWNEGTVSNCSATVDVSGDRYVAGLVGYNYYGMVKNCHSTGNVSGNDYIGGLVGWNNYGTVDNCHSTGNANGDDEVGGLVGRNYHGMVKNCYSTGKVSGIKTYSNYFGGLVGDNYHGTISNCYSTGNVSGDRFVGGIMGENYYGTVSKCYSTGNISGDDYVGGLVGYNRANVENCYSTGNVSGDRFVGGIMGENYYGTVSKCYSTGNVSGNDNIGGLIGAFSGGMIINSFYCINYTSINGKNHVTPYGVYVNQFIDWIGHNQLIEIDDYFQKISGNYYKISSITDLKNLLPFSSGYYRFKQTSDIDMNFEDGFYIPIFSAVEFNGNGNSISNFKVSIDIFNLGLFGIVENALISDISLIDCDVSGNDKVGGLVGYNDYGTVSNCYATGNVSGIGSYSYCIGGLVGYNKGTVSNCYSSGNVRGNNSVGGLVGYNRDGWVSNCYATGNVSGNNSVGGLVGNNDDDVIKCYAIGNVSGNNSVGGLVGRNDHSTVSNSFWDMDTTGQNNSNGGTGKNTTEMTWLKTFAYAGWDLGSIWNIVDGGTYPFLRWETNRAPVITTIDLATATEDLPYCCDCESSDPDPTDIRPYWSLVTEAAWLSIDPITGFLIGTPTNDDVGSHTVNLSVDDGRGGNCSQIFTIVVGNTNDPPEITSTSLETATEDMLYFMSLKAIDIDPTGDSFIWYLNTSADWLSINSTSGVLKGTPKNSDVGSWLVIVSVSDGKGGWDLVSFTLVVENSNDDPVITTEPVTNAVEDEEYSMNLTASDEDVGDLHTWILCYGPDWLSMKGNTLFGTPTNDDVGLVCVEVEVQDIEGGNDRLSFILTVENANDAPTWVTVPGDQYITEGRTLFLNCLAYDMDFNDDISYSISTTPSSNLEVERGQIIWMDPKTGTYIVSLYATDGEETIHHEFRIVVSDAPDKVSEYTDTDGDGMPDWWERYFDLDPGDPSDASGDADGDGISNLDEFIQGSSPLKDDRTEVKEKDDWAMNNIVYLLIALLILALIIIVFLAVHPENRMFAGEDEE